MIQNNSQLEAKYPKASLIIPNLNGKELLRECLISLLNLDYPDYEIIVSDGGSTDGTCQMIQKEFKNVILIQEEGAGIGRANNLGMNAANGEIIAFDLNNDEVFKQDWIKKLVEVLLSSHEIGVVGGSRIVYGTRNIVDEGGYRLNFLCLAKNNHGLILENLSKDPQIVDFVGIPVFRRSLIDKIGMCDEEYHNYFEDSDFCIRAKNAGFKIMWVPEAISYHRRHSTIPSHQKNLSYIITRNKLRFIIKHFSIKLLFPALIFQVIMFPLLKIIYSIYFSTIPIFQSNRNMSLLYVDDVSSYIMGVFKALWWNFKYLTSSFKIRYETQRIISRTRGRMRTRIN